MLTCSIDGCFGRVKPSRLKLCSKHLSRLSRHGDVNYQPYRQPVGEPKKFFEDSIRVETDKCVIWKYNKNSLGYGMLSINNRKVRVHNMALRVRVGPPPKDKTFALHKPIICHNPSCFNYRHLYWGSAMDNSKDIVLDGTGPIGEKGSMAKLRESQVLLIMEDKRVHRLIAADYNVVPQTIDNIKSGKTWKHITSNYKYKEKQ